MMDPPVERQEEFKGVFVGIHILSGYANRKKEVMQRGE